MRKSLIILLFSVISIVSMSYEIEKMKFELEYSPFLTIKDGDSSYFGNFISGLYKIDYAFFNPAILGITSDQSFGNGDTPVRKIFLKSYTRFIRSYLSDFGNGNSLHYAPQMQIGFSYGASYTPSKHIFITNHMHGAIDSFESNYEDGFSPSLGLYVQIEKYSGISLKVEAGAWLGGNSDLKRISKMVSSTYEYIDTSFYNEYYLFENILRGYANISGEVRLKNLMASVPFEYNYNGFYNTLRLGYYSEKYSKKFGNYLLYPAVFLNFSFSTPKSFEVKDEFGEIGFNLRLIISKANIVDFIVIYKNSDNKYVFNDEDRYLFDNVFVWKDILYEKSIEYIEILKRGN